MSTDAQAIVDAINTQTTSVTSSVYGYINDATLSAIQGTQSSIAVWATLIVGVFVGFLIARGIVDPWRK